MKDPTMQSKRSDRAHNSLVNSNQTLMDALRSNSFTRIKTAMNMSCLEVNRKDTDNGGKTVLMKICQLDVLPKSRRELAKLWLQKQNVDANLRDSDGRTVLALACLRGDEGMIKIIAEHSDANPNIVDNLIDTPLMHACRIVRGTNVVRMMITCFGRLNLEVDKMNSKCES